MTLVIPKFSSVAYVEQYIYIYMYIRNDNILFF